MRSSRNATKSRGRKISKQLPDITSIKIKCNFKTNINVKIQFSFTINIITEKIIITLEITTLETYTIANHIKVDIIEVIVDVSPDQNIKIKVDSLVGKINPTTFIITHLYKGPGHSMH